MNKYKTHLVSIKNKVATASAAFLCSVLSSPATFADDTEVYVGAGTSSGIMPNILFIIDTSGSMGWAVPGGDPMGRNRLKVMQDSMTAVLDSISNVRVGLQNFAPYSDGTGGPILYPIRYIDDPVNNAIQTFQVNDQLDDAIETIDTGVMSLNDPLISMVQAVPITSGGTLSLKATAQTDFSENNKVGGQSGTNIAEFGTNTIGYRFANVDIPQGATIDSAIFSLRSAAKDQGKKAKPGVVKIAIEDAVDAQPYSTISPVSSRPEKLSYPSNVTFGKGGANKSYSTPDLKVLVEEITDQTGWNEKQALALKILPVSGKRQMCPPKTVNSGCQDPSLDIVWHKDVTSSGGLDQLVGIRFQDVKIPQGAKIVSATLEFVAKGDSTDPANLTIHGESSVSAAPFSGSNNDISSRATTLNSVSWSGVSDWYDGDRYSSPDVKAIVEEIIADSSWCGGNDLAFIVSGTGRRVFNAFDGADQTLAPKLTVEFEQSTSGCTTGKVTKSVAAAKDDGEYTSGLNNSLDETALNFNAGSYQGYLFKDIKVPKSAKILSANLTLKTKTANTSDSMSTEIYLVKDAKAGAFNSTDLLKDIIGTSNVSWTPGKWNSDSSITTVDISPLIEAKVAGGSWAVGNNLGIVLKTVGGDNSGAVHSYESSPGSTASLTIAYQGAYIPGGVTVRDHLKSTIANLVADGGTPTTGVLAEAARYFRGEAVNTGKYRGSATRPNYRYYTSHPETYTGGTPYIPSGCPGWGSRSSKCASESITGSPVYSSPIKEMCEPNHILFLSDGEPNTFGSITAGVVKGIISNTPGAPASSCSTSGDGSACANDLARTLAKYDQIPGIADKQLIKTHTVSFTSEIPTMKALAQAGGGVPYSADNEETLTKALQDFVQSAVDSTASFVSAGVAVNQFNRLTNDDQLYFSLFKPSPNVNWKGNVKRYTYDDNLGTITGANGKEALSGNQFSDEVLSFWKPSVDNAGQTLIDGKDVTLGGVAASMTTSRKIYTYMGTKSALTDVSNKVDESNTAITSTILGTSSSAERTLVLQWARGLDVNDIDDDNKTTDERMEMGDPMHSRPALVKYDYNEDYPASTNKNDKTVLFVATNQGYLHAINAVDESDGSDLHTKDGNELWAFIPPELLKNLKTYQQSPSGQSHPYGLDGPITIYHEDSDKDGLIDSSKDKAILYVGMRRGGRNYYALDITNLDAPKLLFTIAGGTSSAMGDYTELGQTWSSITPAKIKWGGAEKNVIIFGGGYDVNQDNEGTASIPDAVGRTIFIADALTGNLLWSAKVNALDPTSPWPSSAGAKAALTAGVPGDIKAIDFNNNGYIDTFYAATINGQVLRFDINEANTDKDDFATGGRIALLNDNTVAGNRRFFYAPDPALVVLNNDENFVAVSIGSGYRAHPLNTETQEHFYVLRDYGVLKHKFDADIRLADLADVSEAVTDSAAAALISSSNGKGWYIDLSNSNVGKKGEKVTAPSLTVNNTVVFSTYIPPTVTTSTSCSPSEGSGRTWFVNILDGTPIEQRMVDVEKPQLSDRHTDENVAGLPPGVIPLFTDDGLVLMEGKNVLAAPPPPPGDPLKVYRRRMGRDALTFPTP